MTDNEEKVECRISKTKIIKGAGGMVLEEHSLTVTGIDLKNVEKVFDRQWKK